MNRRRYLAGAGLALTASVAGCALVSDQDGTEPGEGGGTGSDPDDDSSTDGADGSDGTDGSDGDDQSDGSGDDVDSVPELTGYTVSEIAPNPQDVGHELETSGRYITTEAAAEKYYGYLADEEGDAAATAHAFVEETDFDNGERLLYLLGFGSQTCYELVLADDPMVTDNGIPRVETAANRTAPAEQPCGDAITPIDLLVRLSFDPSAGSPDVVEATVPTMDGSPVEVTLDADGEIEG